MVRHLTSVGKLSAVTVVCVGLASGYCAELVCCPKKVVETEEKSYWKVTCEHVCIPGFRFPWECKKSPCGCECLFCGRVRAVNVLEEATYECEKCGYEWEVKCVRTGGPVRQHAPQCPRCAKLQTSVTTNTQ